MTLKSQTLGTQPLQPLEQPQALPAAPLADLTSFPGNLAEGFPSYDDQVPLSFPSEISRQFKAVADHCRALRYLRHLSPSKSGSPEFPFSNVLLVPEGTCMQTDFQQAMKHRRAVSRDGQQMQALMESEPDALLFP